MNISPLLVISIISLTISASSFLFGQFWDHKKDSRESEVDLRTIIARLEEKVRILETKVEELTTENLRLMRELFRSRNGNP